MKITWFYDKLSSMLVYGKGLHVCSMRALVQSFIGVSEFLSQTDLSRLAGINPLPFICLSHSYNIDPHTFSRPSDQERSRQKSK